MSKVVVMDHPLIQHKIGVIRKKETGTREFRDMISEIGVLITYEATKDLKLQDVEIDENALKKPEAIIRSMTPRERRNPGILNASRRKRIAAGSGTTVQDVNALIRQFEQAKDMMKKMMGNKMMRKGKRRFPF